VYVFVGVYVMGWGERVVFREKCFSLSVLSLPIFALLSEDISLKMSKSKRQKLASR
jgi:hypothetical protein